MIEEKYIPTGIYVRVNDRAIPKRKGFESKDVSVFDQYTLEFINGLTDEQLGRLVRITIDSVKKLKQEIEEP